MPLRNTSQHNSLCRQRGSGTVLIATVMLVLAVVAGVAFTLTSWTACLHRARNAADLAALAGASAYQAGLPACKAVTNSAKVNRATVTDCQIRSNSIDFMVQVTVSVPLHPKLPFGSNFATAISKAGAIG
jgi:secretion/DNA translocation related TadE-like protein